jgi:hypothetical protein
MHSVRQDKSNPSSVRLPRWDHIPFQVPFGASSGGAEAEPTSSLEDSAQHPSRPHPSFFCTTCRMVTQHHSNGIWSELQLQSEERSNNTLPGIMHSVRQDSPSFICTKPAEHLTSFRVPLYTDNLPRGQTTPSGMCSIGQDTTSTHSLHHLTGSCPTSSQLVSTANRFDSLSERSNNTSDVLL